MLRLCAPVSTRHDARPAMMMRSTVQAANVLCRFRGLPVSVELVKEALRDMLLVREIASMMTFQAVNFRRFIGGIADAESGMKRAELADLG